MYVLCNIVPALDGSGEWQSSWSEDDVEWADLTDVLRDTCGTATPHELSYGAALPPGLDDISGRVRNPPDRLYGWLDERGEAQYCGVEYMA